MVYDRKDRENSVDDNLKKRSQSVLVGQIERAVRQAV